jgi:signal transduction histidine kinase
VQFQVFTSSDKTIITDGELLSAAVSNMIENAVMYRATEKDATVKISVERHNGTLQIMVRDNGSGIDIEIADKIFNMFFRGTQRSNGAGLGLYIAKEAIKRLQGEIQVTTDDDTTFIISIPVK